MTVANDERLRNLLADYVVTHYLSRDVQIANIEVGPLEVNSFSICFWINATGEAETRGAYVKIPKVIFYRKDRRTILPLSHDDRALAVNEYRSLVHLSRNWSSSETGVHFVRLLGFIEDYNAIVTERFLGRHFFKTYRHYDMWSLRRARRNDAHEILARVGSALSKYHDTSKAPCTVNVEQIVSKMKQCCEQLAEFGVAKSAIAEIVRRIAALGCVEDGSFRTLTMKGLDVRQLFVDNAGKVLMLDPGKLKADYCEQDLARFVVTCRILYWGSTAHAYRNTPHRSYEESFLSAYYEERVRPSKLLSLLTVKELLKHWRMAHASLSARAWPAIMQRALRRAYVDPFYLREVRLELASLESLQ